MGKATHKSRARARRGALRASLIAMVVAALLVPVTAARADDPADAHR